MTAAFWCPRRSFLRRFGPLAAEFRRRGWRTMVLIPAAPLFPPGPKDDASVGAIAHEDLVGVVNSAAALLGLCRGTQTRVLFHTGLRWPAVLDEVRAELRFYDRVRFASMGYHEEEFLHVLETPDRVRQWDAIFTWDPDALGIAASRYASIAVVRDSIQALGDPMADQVTGDFRARLGVARDRRLVLYLPAANAHLLRSRWLGRWYRRAPWNLPWAPWGDLVPSQRRVAALVRRYCDRHGALMLVKERAKSPAPAWLRRMADWVIGDDSFCPSTLLGAMRAADLVVGLAGGWAVEALMAERTTLSILPYPQSAYEHPLLLPIRERLYDTRWAWRVDAFLTHGWDWLEEWAAVGSWSPSRLPSPETFRPGASARIVTAVERLT